MKNLKIISKMAILVALASTLVVSCNKDEVKKDPNYVGTWVNTTTQGVITVTTTAIFTSSTLSYNTDLGNVNMLKESGTMTVANGKMSQTITSITMPDMSKYDPANPNNIPTITVKKGDAGWDAAVKDQGGTEVSEVTYSVSGNKLTHKADANNDGDFTDEGETIEFTKK